MVYKLKIFYFSLRTGGTEQQLLHGREILEGWIRLASQSPDDDKVRDDLERIDLLYDDVAGYVFKLDVVHECFDFFPSLIFFRKSKRIQNINLNIIEFPLQLVLHHMRAA